MLPVLEKAAALNTYQTTQTRDFKMNIFDLATLDDLDLIPLKRAMGIRFINFSRRLAVSKRVSSSASQNLLYVEHLQFSPMS